MRGVEQQLEELTRCGHSRMLLQAYAESCERGGRSGVEGSDLVPEVGERWAHAGGDTLEAGAQYDKLSTESGEVGAELGGEALEGHVGAELDDVGIRVEARRRKDSGRNHGGCAPMGRSAMRPTSLRLASLRPCVRPRSRNHWIRRDRHRTHRIRPRRCRIRRFVTG